MKTSVAPAAASFSIARTWTLGSFSYGPSGVHVLQLDLLFGSVLDVARVRSVWQLGEAERTEVPQAGCFLCLTCAADHNE